MQSVLDSVRRLVDLGVRRLITTPHIEGSRTHDPHALEHRLSEVTAAWESAAEAIGREFSDVEYRRGHEVMIDVPDPDLSDPRIRMAGTSFVLIEWPWLGIPPGTVEAIQRMRAQGYRPIVAHPERYQGNPGLLNLAGRWRGAGAYLQVNYGSLAGRYGSEARSNALELLRRGWVDYLSSDFHGRNQLKIYKREAWSLLEELEASSLLSLMCITNPARVLSDEEPLPVPPLEAERGLWTRLKEMLSRESA
jgi:protein-tyrosine phosphatase